MLHGLLTLNLDEHVAYACGQRGVGGWLFVNYMVAKTHGFLLSKFFVVSHGAERYTLFERGFFGGV